MRKEKQLLLDEVKGQLSQYSSFVVMHYMKLSANKANSFRRDVAKLGGTVEVMRKRILVKAAESVGVNLDLKSLPGHIGMVYVANEPIEMAKFVIQFGNENGKAVQVVGGRIDGQLYNAVEVEALSKLPGKDEMRAQLLSVFEAPMAETLAVMDALLSSVVYCLDNKANEKTDAES